MTLQGTLFFVVLAVLGLNLRVLATVPAGFTEIGEFFPPCQFASNESSPFPFNFDLSALQEGEEISYFASTCSSVVTAPISGLTGTCDGGAACLCSTGLGECVIIGNATTLSWLVSTVEEDPLTVVQRFTSPSCSVDPDKEWQTYLIYECDESPSAYGAGTIQMDMPDQRGLCPGDATGCNQCLKFSTNFACESFPSSETSFVTFGQYYQEFITSGSSTPSVATLNARDQFGQFYPHSGAEVTVGISGDTANVISASVQYQGNDQYNIALFAGAGLAAGSQKEVVSVTVFLEGYQTSAYQIVVEPEVPKSGGGSPVTAIVLSILGVLVVAAGVLAVFRYRRYGYVLPRRRPKQGLASSGPVSSSQPPSLLGGPAPASQTSTSYQATFGGMDEDL